MAAAILTAWSRVRRKCRAWVVLGIASLSIAVFAASSRAATVTVATYSMERYEIMRDVLLPRWQAKYPHIEIEVQMYPGFFDRMIVVMGTEQAPDIIDTAGTYLFGHVIRGGAVDLAPFIERDTELAPEDFWAGPWNEVRWPQPDGSGIYGLPYDIVGTVMYYNKSLLSSAGVPFPDEAWSWFDVRDAARKVARDLNGDRVNEIWGFNLNLGHTVYDLIVKSFGGRILSEDRRRAAINSPEAAAATQFFVDLILQDRSAAIGPAFHAGNVGISVDGSYYVRTIGPVEDIDWGVTLTPKGPVRRVVYGGSNVWEVMRRPGQDMEAVLTILKELLSQETIEAFWTSYHSPYSLPGTRRVTGAIDLTPMQQLLAQSVEFMEDGEWSPDWAVWQAAKRQEITPATTGERSVAEALLRAQQEIDKVLANAYAQ